MILDDIRQLKTGPRELRRFGLLVGGVFAAWGALLLLRHKPHFVYPLAPGLALVLLGLVLPKLLKPIYIAWMSLAIVLGFVVSTVILTCFFFLLITPVGLAARIAGRDFMSRKMRRDESTYWIRRAPAAKTAKDYERQF